MNIEEDLTRLIDFEKYQQYVNARRHPRNANSLNQTKSSICSDLKSEEYQKCGNKCVLGCRYDSLVSGNASLTENCNATKCIEGCFCKEGLVRYHKKCIPATECPTRKSKAIGMIYENPNQPSRLFGIFQRPCGPIGCKPTVHIQSHSCKKPFHCESMSLL